MDEVPRNPRQRQRLAEIESWIDEAHQREHLRAAEATGRTQLALLRTRLLKLGVLGPDEFAEKAVGNWWDDPNTGEVRVWFLIEDRGYYKKDGEVYVEREGKGALEWTTLDSNGQPVEPWQREPPPWGLADFN